MPAVAHDIVQIASGNSDFSTLVTAVKAAGLVDTLSGAGPFTVFAPMNAAFSALPAGTLDSLLKPENKGTLTSILTYHVVPGS
ncbi:MAG TPA: fasciclin domain-containing protein, partial [Candidatus Dormibacteraeota bacterium]|nr:fasciclin domain-containing protein [Candidatus Dormibacteraeota bacterium]